MDKTEKIIGYESPKVVAVNVKEYCAKLSSCGVSLLNTMLKGCHFSWGPSSECDRYM